MASTPIVVHGHPGTAILGEIEWTEQGQLVTVRSITHACATLTLPDLLASGNGPR